MEKGTSKIASYSVAVLAVAAGISLPLASKPFVGQSAPFLSFVPAVLLSAWYGGFIPGLVTAALLGVATLVLDDVLFTDVAPAAKLFSGFMFGLASLAVCLVIRAMRLAQAAAQEAATAAKAAEARAKAGRDRLDIILRDLPVGVVIATEKGKVELANPAAMEIHGAPLRTGDDIPFRQQFPLPTPTTAEPAAGWPLERSLRNNETVVNHEIDILRGDGSFRALIINSRPLESGAEGNQTAMATYSDVTSLRAAQKALLDSEARLRRLFDSPIIGVVSGEGDVALEANDCFLQMLGYTREDLSRRKIVFSRLTPDAFETGDARALGQLADRGFTDPFEKELIAADGRAVPVMVGATSISSGKDSPWIAWVLDLSEHRKLEERLRQAAKAESIGLLAGGVAHDFNNLLTIIIGNVSLADGIVPPNCPSRQHIGKTLRAAERAADLTRQLLAYAGKGTFVVREADVSSAIREVSQLFRASAPKEVEIRLALEEHLPRVSADVTQLQQLVMNLVINAVESIGGRAGSVSVSTSAVYAGEEFLRTAELVENLDSGYYVTIEVRDDGCGMDADTRMRIFDPFFTTKFVGRGLGLAAALGIVRAHRGGMIVRSSPGQGSIFQVFLPVAASRPPHSERDNAAEPIGAISRS